MSQQPAIDGDYVSWAQLGIILAPLGGQDIKTSDFSALDWDHKLEGENVPGAGPMNVGRTTGIYERSASTTMWWTKANEFKENLMDLGAPRGLGYMQVPFDLISHYIPLGQIVPLIWTVKIPGCKITSEAVKNASGPAPTAVEFSLSVGGVIEVITPTGKRLSPLVVSGEF